jgi:hypothetical protein
VCQKKEERKVKKIELRKVVKEELKDQFVYVHKYSNFHQVAQPDCYPSFGAKFCLGLIATLAS